jgi:HAD superfamily, subfamily IIIB (Acid phosphatase)
MRNKLVDQLRSLSAAAAAAAIALVLAGTTLDPSMAQAPARCDRVPPPITLEMTQPLNLGQLKLQALRYACSGVYDGELAKIASEAQAYVERRAAEVTRPALVLDIDETSLSNFPEIVANDFGFIPEGPCDVLPKGPCGWRSWEGSARARAIAPTLALFKAAKGKGVAVFFITGRRESDDDRKSTIRNLQDAGYDGWAGLSLRPPTDHDPSVVPFKSGERARIAAQGYTIITNMGDQESDLAGGYAERAWRLPNPFYFIP